MIGNGTKGAVAAAMLIATPAAAKWTMIREAVPVSVAKSGMKVVAGSGWNLRSAYAFKKGESWSYDGPLLNELSFFGAVANGEPLAKDRNKKYKPLPKFERSMLPSDIAQLYEQTQRIALDTPDFAIDAIAPVQFAGRPGFKFNFHYTRPDEELTRKGEARGAVIGGKLFMITYVAAAIHYYDAGIAQARAVMASATVS